MKRVTILILLIITGWGCHHPKPGASHSVDSTHAKKLTVSFAVNDSIIDINENFLVMLKSPTDSVSAMVKKKEIFVPKLVNDTGYVVHFVYKDHHLSFANFSRRMVFPGQEMEWKFAVEYPPFNKYGWLLNNMDSKSRRRIKQIQYLGFDLMEHGDGIMKFNAIE